MRGELQDLSSYSVIFFFSLIKFAMIRGFSPSSQVRGCTVTMLVSHVVHWRKSSNHRPTSYSMLDTGRSQEVQGRRRKRRGPSWSEGKYNDSSNFNVGCEILFWVCVSSAVPYIHVCTKVCDSLWIWIFLTIINSSCGVKGFTEHGQSYCMDTS